MSAHGNPAHVVATYFGGTGYQSATLYRKGRLIIALRKQEGAINQVLKAMGVRRSETTDEFDTLGLGRHDDTEEWVMPPK